MTSWPLDLTLVGIGCGSTWLRAWGGGDGEGIGFGFVTCWVVGVVVGAVNVVVVVLGETRLMHICATQKNVSDPGLIIYIACYTWEGP